VPSPAHLAWLALGLLRELSAAGCPDLRTRALELECRVMAHWIGCPVETEPLTGLTHQETVLDTPARRQLAALFLHGVARAPAPPTQAAAPVADATPPSSAAAAEDMDEATHGEACEERAGLGADWGLTTAFVAAQPALTGAATAPTCRRSAGNM